MNNFSFATRLLSFTAALAVMLGIFQIVTLLPETLPDVQAARAHQMDSRLASAGVLLASTQPASGGR